MLALPALGTHSACSRMIPASQHCFKFKGKENLSLLLYPDEVEGGVC